MLNQRHTSNFLETNSGVGILLLRIFIGGRLLYGVIDNVISWERMLEFAAFLQANDFLVPVFSAVVSVYVQFLGALFILAGFRIRWASFILAVNFLIALIAVHLRAGDTVEGMTPALAMLFGCLTLLFTGAEQISLDHYLRSEKSS